MAKDTTQPKESTSKKPKVHLQLWNVPKYGVSVMAASLEEAVKKAEAMKKSSNKPTDK